jgi:ADP-heptose:LPS heptosyltransferase
MHAWSGGYMGQVKEWPSDRWVELARRLYERSRLHVVVSGGPGDVDRSRELAAAIVGAGVPATSIAGQFSLLELADVLVASTMVVSVNTGVMHLSALVGAPTVSLEGPVAVHRWGPVGPRVHSVVTTLPNCGYLDLGFEYAGERLDCMDGVSVDAVVEAVEALSTSMRGVT